MTSNIKINTVPSRVLHRSLGPLLASVMIVPATPLLAQQSVTSLSTIVVEDAVPGNGTIAKESAAATRTKTPVQEIPQSISVVTSKTARLQSTRTVPETLRYTPGVSSEISGPDPRADWTKVRGFTVAEYLDGMRLPRATYAWTRVDPMMLDRIEVLKGPSGSMYGLSSPGGLLNYISKRPTGETFGEVGVEFGYPNSQQVHLDVGGVIDPDGTLSYRLIGLGRNAQTAVDFVDSDRKLVAPSFTYAPDDVTSFTVLAHHLADDGGALQFLPGSGTALFNPNGQLPRSLFVGEPDFEDFSRRQTAIGYEFNHEFDNGIRLSHAVRGSAIDYSLDTVRGWGLASGSDEMLERGAVSIRDDARNLTSDTHLGFDFETGPVKHEFVTGFDYLWQNADYKFGSGNVADLNVYNPVYGSPVGAINFFKQEDQTLRQAGLYVQDQIRWNNVGLVLGLRADQAETDTLNKVTGSRTKTDDFALTGRVGLMYHFDNGVSPYVSYSTAFEPQVGTASTGEAFVPTESEQIEIGLKYQPAGTNHLLTFALFDITQDNVVVNDPVNYEAYQVGRVGVRGAEVEGKFAFDNGFEVMASYTYLDTEIQKTIDGTTGNRLADTPEHQAALWANYTFDENTFDGLTVGAGVRYTGSVYGDRQNQVLTKGYALVDMALRYDLGAINKDFARTEFTLSVSNLFDKKFVASCNDEYTCYWGGGRTIRGGLVHKW